MKTRTTTALLVAALMMMVAMPLSAAMEVFPQDSPYYPPNTVFCWAESSATTEYPWIYGDGYSCGVGRGVIHSYVNYGAYEITVNQEVPVFVGIYPTGMLTLGELTWEVPTEIMASSSEEGYPASNAIDLSQVSLWIPDPSDSNPTLTVSALSNQQIVALEATFNGNGTAPLTEIPITLITSAGENNCDITIPEGNTPSDWHSKDWIPLRLENPGQTVAIEFSQGTPAHCIEVRIATTTV